MNKEAEYKIYRVENGWILMEAKSFGKTWLCNHAADIGATVQHEYTKDIKRDALAREP